MPSTDMYVHTPNELIFIQTNQIECVYEHAIRNVIIKAYETYLNPCIFFALSIAFAAFALKQ